MGLEEGWDIDLGLDKFGSLVVSNCLEAYVVMG